MSNLCVPAVKALCMRCNFSSRTTDGDAAVLAANSVRYLRTASWPALEVARVYEEEAIECQFSNRGLAPTAGKEYSYSVQTSTVDKSKDQAALLKSLLLALPLSKLSELEYHLYEEPYLVPLDWLWTPLSVLPAIRRIEVKWEEPDRAREYTGKDLLQASLRSRAELADALGRDAAAVSDPFPALQELTMRKLAFDEWDKTDCERLAAFVSERRKQCRAVEVVLEGELPGMDFLTSKGIHVVL